MDKMKRFIDIHVPVTACNLHCHYCYVADTNKRNSSTTSFLYSAEHIGKALTKKRLGGICHFNMCGLGETLIPKEMTKIVQQILLQGHYIMIVNNGLITRRIDELLNLPKELLMRLGFKFSFHYLELIRTNQLDEFINNFRKVKEAGCSFSIEVTPSDELEPYIEDLKDISLENFGALPHITVPRKESNISIPLMSKHSVQEFKEIWSQFDSELFNFKLSMWQVKRKEYCYAGVWSGILNIGNGEFVACYASGLIQNIFENIKKPIKFVPVGKHCKMPHCYNAHVFLTLGDIPSINTHTYAQVRNRVCSDGSEWLNIPMKNFLSNRLDDANYEFNNIEKLEMNVKRINSIYSNALFRKIQKLTGRFHNEGK
jgi:MoaA/NifB/PqqE/SkfB family radical SAM enzyme